MPILDHILYFNCPEECGQLAVPCSLRMILNNDVIFCEACGCEFQASLFPQWLQQATCAEENSDDAALEDMMTALYSYLYANGACPAENIISQLLQEDFNLWHLFPPDKIAIQDVIKLLGIEEFAAVFDFSALSNEQITELLIRHPGYISKCDSSKLLPENWLDLIIKQPQFAENCSWDDMIAVVAGKSSATKITKENSEELFKIFPYRSDSRFSRSKSAPPPGEKAFPGSAEDFWATINYFDFYPNIDWSQIAAADILPLVRKYPRIIEEYPFDSDNLMHFDWNSFSEADWEIVKSQADIPECLVVLCQLSSGKNVSSILKDAPQLRKYCNWHAVLPAEWANILIAFPDDKSYWQYCNWHTLDETAWRKVLEKGKNTFAIAVYNALHGQKISTILKEHPDAKPYIAWNKINIDDWFDLLAEDLHYAEICPWHKIYEYIKNLPPPKRQSIKNRHRQLWGKRTELLNFVDFSKLQTLPADQYYSIVDFFDWEENFDFPSLSSDERIDLFVKHPQFCERYGFENLTSQEKVSIAIRSAAFGENYGWTNFTNDEILAIVTAQPDYVEYFKSRCSFRKILRQLANISEEIAEQYKLNFFDYLFFRKFTSLKLSSKITFLWHFILSLAGFAGFVYLAWDGPCGFLALYEQTKLYSLSSILIYAILFITWSYVHARLFSGRAPFLLTITSAFIGVYLADLQFKYTFFLSKISLANYICWGLLLLVIIIIGNIKKHKNELFFVNKSGLKLLLMIYLPAILATLFICHPFSHNQMLNLSKQLKDSSRPFYSAATYYLRKGFNSDDKSQKIIACFNQELENNQFSRCRELLTTLPEAYSSLPEIQKLDSDLKNKLEAERNAYTTKAIETYERGDYKQLIKDIYHSNFDNREIQFILGKCFHFGLGDHKIDYTQAVKWYKKAISQNHPRAMVNLGNLYSEGKGVSKNRAIAVELYRKAAKQNLAEAQANLGLCYFHGTGVKKDYKKAVKYFSKAAEQNFAESQAQLGKCYYYGHGVEQNYTKALQWLNKSAAQNNMTARVFLGLFYFEGKGTKQDYQKAIKWFTRSAEQGDVLAQVGLGSCYFNTQKYEDAVKWLDKAALQNNAQAQDLLGICYFSGYGVAQDYKEAVKWFRQAADQGFAAAQANLGVCYNNGLGVEQDYYDAVMWYRKAALQGNRLAQCNLGVCYFKGNGVIKDEGEAAKWFRKAALLGDDAAMANLGICYLYGNGVSQDNNEAIKWLRKAKKLGNKDATEFLKKLQSRKISH